MIRKILSLASVVALIPGAIILLTSRSNNAPEPAAPVVIKTVRTARVQRTELPGAIKLYGVTRASRRATLAFTLGGRLSSRPVLVGDSVKRGQVLARLDRRRLRNTVAATAAELGGVEVQVAQTTRDLGRARQLRRMGALAVQSHERARSRQRALKAGQGAMRVKLREARRVLSEATLRAPFAGIVSAVLAEPGELVATGRPVVLLTGVGTLEAQLEAPESVVTRLRRGQAVTVDLPLAGRRGLSGRIKSVGAAALGPGQLFPVVVTLAEAKGLRPGMTAQVTMHPPARAVLVVPVAAVMNPGGAGPTVFTLRRGRVSRVAVGLGDLRDGRVAVQGKLRRGDHVVVAGHASLVDGEAVRQEVKR